MTNLLPPHEQTSLRREYLGRLCIVLLYFLFTTGLCASLIFLPAYVTARIKKQGIEKGIAALEETNGHFERELKEAQALLKQTGDTMALVEARISRPAVFDALMAVMRAQSPGITFGSISYMRQPKGGGMLNVSGVALTREELIALVKRLEGEASFTSVRLPVGDLALGKDSEFSITIEGTF